MVILRPLRATDEAMIIHHCIAFDPNTTTGGWIRNLTMNA
jgi:hypothetical protein